jgi:hypothetical protein
MGFRSEGDEGETTEFIELSWIEGWKGCFVVYVNQVIGNTLVILIRPP